MTTYRTGNHWGVTIVRQGEGGAVFGLDAGPLNQHAGGCRWPADTCTGHADGRRADDELVAVVTNGDTALAERICRLLNSEAHLDHGAGATEGAVSFDLVSPEPVSPLTGKDLRDAV